MDSARRAGPGPTGCRGGHLKRLAVLSCLAVGACSQLSPDFGSAVAITITGSPTPTLEEGDTLTLTAQALDASGAVLTSETVLWSVTNPIKRVDTVAATGAVDTVPRGFTIDSQTGLITGMAPDTANVLAYVGTLRSNAIQVRVTAQPDTISAPTTRLVVALDATESGSLATFVQDITTTPGTARPLGGKKVSYQIVSPAGVTSVYLETHTSPADTLPGPDPTLGSATTAGNGEADIYLRKVAGQTPPDSVFVDATGLTARGVAIKGSPVRFTVVFLNS